MKQCKTCRCRLVGVFLSEGVDKLGEFNAVKDEFLAGNIRIHTTRKRYDTYTIFEVVGALTT